MAKKMHAVKRIFKHPLLRKSLNVPNVPHDQHSEGRDTADVFWAGEKIQARNAESIQSQQDKHDRKYGYTRSGGLQPKLWFHNV